MKNTYTYNRSVVLAKKKISEYTNDQLIDDALSGQNLEAISQEAYRRRNGSLYADLLAIPAFVSCQTCSALACKFIAENANKDSEWFENVVWELLDHPKNVTKAISPFSLLEFLRTPRMVAVALISKGTPDQVVYRLIDKNQLADPKIALYISGAFNQSNVTPGHNTILSEIVKLLQEGVVWENEISGTMLAGRLKRNAGDQFMTDIAQYRLHPSIFKALFSARSDPSIFAINKRLGQNLDKNQSEEAKLTKMSLDEKNITAENLTPVINLALTQDEYSAYLEWAWKLLTQKANDQAFIMKMFEMVYNNKNPMMELAKYSNEYFKAIVNMLATLPLEFLAKRNYIKTEQLVTRALMEDPSMALSTIPEDVFKRIRLTSALRTLVQDYFHPTKKWHDQDRYKVIKRLFGENMNNWYKIAKENGLYKEALNQTSLYKEAGWGGDLLKGLMGALVFLMLGGTASEAAQKYQVSPKAIENAMHDEKTVSQAKQLAEQQRRRVEMEKELGEMQKKQEQAEKRFAQEANIIARTLYREGRGESIQGLRAIGSTIYNRGGGSVEGMISAIKEKKQFSCWNKAKPSDFQRKVEYDQSPIWNECKSIAQAMVNGTFTPTGNWTHYYNPQKCTPSWAYQNGKLRPHSKIGNHYFMILNI